MPTIGEEQIFKVNKFGRPSKTSDGLSHRIAFVDYGNRHCMATFPIDADNPEPWKKYHNKYVWAEYVSMNFNVKFKKNEKGELLKDDKGRLIEETAGDKGERWNFTMSTDEKEERAKLTAKGSVAFQTRSLLNQEQKDIFQAKQAQRAASMEDMEESA